MEDVGLALDDGDAAAALRNLEARTPSSRPVCEGGADVSVIGLQVLYDWSKAGYKEARRAALLGFVDAALTDEEAHRARLHHDAYAELFEWTYRFDYREDENELVEVGGWLVRPDVAMKMAAPV
tara:strand:- start:1873 stop:2244 length:372 start_codon:yes stop_codon:yes gene_type:complete